MPTVLLSLILAAVAAAAATALNGLATFLDALQGDQLASNMWMRSITSPVQLTTYYLGYREVRAVYDEARKTLGQKFDLRAFMDGMMKLGPVAARHYR